MKVLLCPDSYKGSASAKEVAEAMRDGFLRSFEDAECVTLPIADGGEGSVDAILNALGAERIYVEVRGPYGERVRAGYAISGHRAYIEMAEASGICLTKRREPLLATTYGTGELLLDAVKHGAREVTVFIGGSATCDGGIGMASALGYGFFDIDGNELEPVGASMKKIAKIVPPKVDALSGVRVYCACDVTNLMYGEQGASYVFSPQKGADEAAVKELDSGLFNLACVIEKDLCIDVHTLVGGGAAGGLGAGLYAFCSARMRGGFDLISEALSLEKEIAGADIVVTGEGCSDRQSVMGKVIGRISDLCKAHGKRCFVISGMIKDAQFLTEQGIDRVYSCTELAESPRDSMENAVKYIALAASVAAKDI